MGGAVIKSGSGGGGIPEWSAGSYSQGATVTRGPYVWRANATTSEDPLVVEGDLGSASDWSRVAASGSLDSQSSGVLTLINNVAGKACTAYSQSTHSGFLGKMLITDLRMNGAADWMHFGIFDAAASQTASNINSAASTFYGVNINIFNGRIEEWADGVYTGTSVAYSNAQATSAGTAFARWYLAFIQNGANWDVNLYRGLRDAAIAPYNGYDPTNQEDDLVLIAQFANKARPSYTNWRFVVGARTGGSAGTFQCRSAYVRNTISGNWTAIARKPTQLG